jgi:urease accessory protein|tara:strand:- start:175 stop:1233 length:1059 start_codon:yes stop_codon:yes gene_type:complete
MELARIADCVIVSALAELGAPTPTCTVATHAGSFHCDEALATAMLRLVPTYADAPIVRTRDAAAIAACTIAVDVGGTYDNATLRFDHHQRTFDAFFPGRSVTKLSSAGLIYKHYGREVIATLSSAAGAAALSAATLELVYQKVYDDFIEGVDAIDNGVSRHDDDAKYKVKTDLGARVGRLNPSWNEANDNGVRNANFKKAMTIALEELVACVNNIVMSWLPARAIVEAGVVASLPSEGKRGRAPPQILKLPQSCPWQSHLFEIEAEKGMVGAYKYCLYQDGSGKWRVQAVPERLGSFASRKALPEQWRGIRDDALSELSGIPGCIFVHASGFIGGNATEVGAESMAETALTM